MNNIPVGTIFSETNFLVVKEVTEQGITAANCSDLTKEVVIPHDYISQQYDSFNFCDLYETEASLSLTEADEYILKSPNKCMTICYDKKPVVLSDQQYQKEKEDRMAYLKTLKGSALTKGVQDVIDNPVLKVLPGEERIIKGYHMGKNNTLGRLNFFDLEISDKNKFRQVDLRTVKYFIVDGIKYNVVR